jgi:hypothetical protein
LKGGCLFKLKSYLLSTIKRMCPNT